MKQILFGLLFFPLSLFGQNDISGTVVSQDEGVSYATIQIKETKLRMITDEYGDFELEDAPEIPFTIIASFVGYKPTNYIVERLDQPITIELEPLENSLNEIVVTGTMSETYVKDSPVKVDVVTNKRIETYLPSAGTSIVENVSLVNGVQEVIACGVCFTNQLSINGLSGENTAVLIDGTPIYGNLASVYGLNGIANQIIDRFEVIKGPSSTLYGSEAIAGVINIITKDPKYEPNLSLDIMGTSQVNQFVNLSATPRLGQSHGFIGVNIGRQDFFQDQNSDGFSDAIHLDRVSVFSKWNLNRTTSKQFSLSAKYYYEDRRNGVEQFLDDPTEFRGSNEVYGESIYTERVELFGTYEFNSKQDLKLDISLSNHNQDSFYGSDHYVAEQQIAFANFTWQKQVSNHDILSGSTVRFNNYDDNTIATEGQIDQQVINQPNNQFIPGLFVQDEWKISDRVSVLSGVRLDHYDQHGLIPAPRVSGKFKLADFTDLRANFGTGFRVINLFTEDHAFITGQRSVEIVEDLHPEESLNGSINLIHDYNSSLGTGNIELDAYYTYFTNQINPNYDEPTKIIYENTDGHAMTKGFGSTITHNFKFPLGINIGVNWQRATQTDNGQQRDIEFAPRFSSVGTANYYWDTPNIILGYTANFTGRLALPEVFDVDENGVLFASPRPTTSTPFSVHSFKAEKTFNNGFKLYSGIQNLWNFTQEVSPLVGFNDPTAAVGFSDNFDTSYAYAPTNGREAYIGFKWDLK